MFLDNVLVYVVCFFFMGINDMYIYLGDKYGFIYKCQMKYDKIKYFYCVLVMFQNYVYMVIRKYRIVYIFEFDIEVFFIIILFQRKFIWV